MLPDLIRAASKGAGSFAGQSMGFGLRTPDVLVTVLSTGDLVIEPWRVADGAKRPKVSAPELRRSGTPVEGRERAIPLFDRCDYTLGFAESDDRTRTDLLNAGYLRDLGKIAADTGNDRLRRAHEALSDRTRVAAAIAKSKSAFQQGTVLRSASVVAVSDEDGPLYEDPDYVTYWQNYVAGEIGDADAPLQQCSICGRDDQPVVDKLPSEIVLTGQKCQISSFNAASFQSYGKSQTRQASICVACASRAPVLLQSMLQEGSQHSSVIYRHTPRTGKSDPMKCITAVWWIEPPVVPDLDLDDLLADLAEVETQVPVVIGLQGDDISPVAEAKQLQKLLGTVLAGSGSRRDAVLDRTAFHVVLLAPNTGRLIVRDHLRQDVSTLAESALRFILAARGFRYDERERTLVRRPFGATSLARVLHNRGTETPTLLRSLLRTAMCGDAPSPSVARKALTKLTRLLITGEKDDGVQDAATAALLLYLNHIDPRYRTMTEANEITEEVVEPIDSVAFLCGRLLAMLDLIQRAGDPKVPKTVAERIINQAATFPARNLRSPLKRTVGVYLPKLRDRMPGLAYQYDATLNTLVGRIAERGGIPETLTASQEAELMTGFLMQRGLSQQNRQARQDQQKTPAAA